MSDRLPNQFKPFQKFFITVEYKTVYSTIQNGDLRGEKSFDNRTYYAVVAYYDDKGELFVSKPISAEEVKVTWHD